MRFSYLLNTISKGSWAIAPRIAEFYAEQVVKLTTRDWDGMQTADLNKSTERAPIPVMIITNEGNKISASYGDDEENDAPEQDNCNPFENAPMGSTAIIPLKGVMIKYGTMCQYGTEEIASLISMAAKTQNISSIILDIDTGGGSVDSVAPIIDAIKQSGKPFVAYADLCASAGYWVASACDKIIASNDISSEFGSIGVMMSFCDMQPYYEKMGVKFHSINSDLSSFKNKAFTDAKADDYTTLKAEQLNPLAVKFQNAVKQNRGSKLNQSVEGILEGKMFFASDAKNNGLIDEIGNMQHALKVIQDIAAIKDIQNSNYKF